MKQIFTMDVEQDIFAARDFAKLLASHKIRGEFYITGKLAEQYPKICREIGKSHIIGCHAYNHENFARLSYEDAEFLIKKTIDAFKKNKINLKGWRFPGFSFRNSHLKILVKHGLYDSSINEKAFRRWNRFFFIRNLLSNIKRGAFFLPVMFPKSLDERPWSVVDLNDKEFYTKPGRLVSHCYNYRSFKDEITKYLNSN